MLKITEHSRFQPVDFKTIRIKECFKRVGSNWIYFRIVTTDDKSNAINLTTGDLAKFADGAAVYPVEAELIVR